MHEDVNAEVAGERHAPPQGSAFWSARGDDGRAKWAVAPAGSMVAVELTPEGAGTVVISISEAAADIAHCLGNPVAVESHRPLRGVQFWFGVNRGNPEPTNATATWCICRLLSDASSGEYIASTAERRFARSVLGAPGNAAFIRGRCLITGAGVYDEPAALDADFERWFPGLFGRVNPLEGSPFGDLS